MHLTRTLLALVAASLPFSGQLDAKENQEPVQVLEPVHASVCHLDIHRSRGKVSTGSAMLFESRYLLTAGHNLMQDWTRIERIDIRCGVTDAAQTPVQRVAYGPQTITAPAFRWWRFYPKQHDYGVIRLAEPIGTATPIPLAQAPVQPGQRVCLFGYPGEDHGGYTLFDGCAPVLGQAFFDKGFRYDLTTYRSNSGGPVLRAAADGNWELVGIHIQPSSAREVIDGGTQIRDLIKILDDRAARSDAEGPLRAPTGALSR